MNTLHVACRGVTMSQRDMLSKVNLLAKDLKCFGKGVESTGGGVLLICMYHMLRDDRYTLSTFACFDKCRSGGY